MRRIMVVDPDPATEGLIRSRYRESIADADLHFVFASNRHQALTLLNREAMDVLIIDVSGGTTEDRLKPMENLMVGHPLMPVIAVAGSQEMQRIRHAMNLGAFDFLPKPLDPADLSSTLARALRQVQLLEAQEQLRHQKLAAENASHTKDIFLTNMSHELRTPLNAIIGYSEMLMEELDDPEELSLPRVASDLERITNAGKHLLKLVDEILDLSRIQAGELYLDAQMVPIAPLVREAAELIMPALRERQSRLQVGCPEDLGSMVADAAKLRQSICNLLDFLTLESSERHLELQVSTEQASGLDWILFAVSDTGRAQDADALEQLFQPFMQPGSAVLPHPRGGVLRLSITRQLCRQMGGDLLVRGHPLHGASLVIRLPRRDRRRRDRDRRRGSST